MKDNLNIEELFKEKFSSFEGEVSPNAWTNIQQGVNAANATAGAAAAKTGISLFMKASILTGGIVVATIGGLYFFGEDEKSDATENNLVENTVDTAVNINNEVVVPPTVDNVAAKTEITVNENQNTIIVGSEEPKSNVIPVINSPGGLKNSINDGGNTTPQDNGDVLGDEDSGVDIKNNSDNGIGSEKVVRKDNNTDPIIDIDYPSGKMSFIVGNQFAPSTYSFESNATNFTKVRWDFGDGAIGEGENVEHTFEKAGSYSVRLTVLGEGEVYEESQTITIKAKSGIDNISNVITPNGDRINDFFIVNSHNIETFYIVIRDKKRTIVFETKDPDFKWYGVDLGGNTLEIGVYFYDIYAKGTDSSEFKISGEIRIE